MTSSENSAPTNREARPPSGSSEGKGWFQSFVALCQALAWPIVILVMFSYCKKPITAILNEIPKTISKSKKITVSGVILDIGSTVAVPPDVKSSIANISKEELIQLINISEEDHWVTLFSHVKKVSAQAQKDIDQLNKDYVKAFKELDVVVIALEKRHLIKVKKRDINPINPDLSNISVKLTDLGRQTRKCALDIIIDQLTAYSGDS